MYELTEIFSTILDLSVTVLPVLAVVLAARLLLRRRGLHRVAYGLWVVVGLRLALPVSLPSPVSLFNWAPVQQVRNVSRDVAPTLSGLSPSGAPIEPIMIPPEGLYDKALLNQPRPTLLGILAALWLLGVLLLLLYALGSYVSLKRRLDCAVLAGDNVWESEAVDTPFVLGLFRPRIYLPLGLSEEERTCVLLHERTHIRRGDIWVKPLAYLFLAVYWFHPGVWLAWFCLGRDMEQCCDEAVLRRLGAGVKTEYSKTLLTLATARRFPAPSPLSFGEHDASARIRHVLKWKKAAPAATFLAVALCVLVAAVCVTDGMKAGSWVMRRLGGTTSTEQSDGMTVGFDMRSSAQVGEVRFYQESYRNGQREADRPFMRAGVGGVPTETEVELTAIPDRTTGEVDWIVRHGGAVTYNQRGKELFEGNWTPPTGERRYFGQSMSILGDGHLRQRQELEPDDDVVLMAWFFMKEGDDKPFTCESITETSAAEAAKVFDRVILLRMKLTPIAGTLRPQGLVEEIDGGGFAFSLDEGVRTQAYYADVYDHGNLYARQLLAYRDFQEQPERVFEEAWGVELGQNWAKDFRLLRREGEGVIGLPVPLPEKQYRGASGLAILEPKTKKSYALSYGWSQVLGVAALSSYESAGILSLSPEEFQEDLQGRLVEQERIHASDVTVLLRVVHSDLPIEELDALEQARKEEWKAEETSAGVQARMLWELAVPYLGDAPAVGQLLQALSVDIPSSFSMELFTKESPLALQLDFRAQSADQEAADRLMWEKGCLLLALVGNLEEVRWTYPNWDEQGKETLITQYLSLEQAEENLRLGERDNVWLVSYTSLKDCGNSPEALQNLLNYLNAN